MKNLQDLKKELFKRPGVRQEYYKRDKDSEIAQMVEEARITLGLTQEELARRIGTKQPSIARLESGGYTPSFKLLRAIADALSVNLEVRFSNMEGIGVSKHIVQPTIELDPRKKLVSFSSQRIAENSYNVE